MPQIFQPDFIGIGKFQPELFVDISQESAFRYGKIQFIIHTEIAVEC